MDELKPCPFCGGLAIISEDSGGTGKVFNVWHQCKKGKGHFNKYGSVGTLTIDTGWYYTRKEAIAAWNRREGEEK